MTPDTTTTDYLTPEVRAAAERIRKAESATSTNSVYSIYKVANYQEFRWGIDDDSRTLARAYMADLAARDLQAAQDAEPLTWEIVEQRHGLRYDSEYGEWVAGNGVAVLNGLDGWYARIGDDHGYRLTLRTSGDLRRLLEGLGWRKAGEHP